MFEGDQEVFRDGEVETLGERGETETYGSVEDSPRRRICGEQG